MQNILPRKSSIVGAIYGAVSKAVGADTAWKAERGMGCAGAVQAAKMICAPPSWNIVFPLTKKLWVWELQVSNLICLGIILTVCCIDSYTQTFLTHSSVGITRLKFI